MKILKLHEGEVKDPKILKKEDFPWPEFSKILEGPNMDFTRLGIYKEELVGSLAQPRSLFFTKYIMIYKTRGAILLATIGSELYGDSPIEEFRPFLL